MVSLWSSLWQSMGGRMQKSGVAVALLCPRSSAEPRVSRDIGGISRCCCCKPVRELSSCPQVGCDILSRVPCCAREPPTHPVMVLQDIPGGLRCLRAWGIGKRCWRIVNALVAQPPSSSSRAGLKLTWALPRPAAEAPVWTKSTAKLWSWLYAQWGLEAGRDPCVWLQQRRFQQVANAGRSLGPWDHIFDWHLLLKSFLTEQ